MPELSATALFGAVLSVLFFSLGTSTIVQANKTAVVSKNAYSPSEKSAIPKDYANIVFGSLFLTFAIVLAFLTGRAVFSV
jgi:hypothetical protein